MKKNRIAYLISQYPAISHTFILREIRTLRQLGLDIQSASINDPDRDDVHLTAEEQAEKQYTYYIKSAGLMGILKPHLRTLLTHPWRYSRGLLFALHLGRFDLKKILYGFFYFIEAVMIGEWMRRHQITHLHVHIPMSAATVGLIAQHTFPITFSMTVHGPNEFYDVPGNYLPQKILDAAFICCISHFATSQMMLLSPATVWHKFEVCRLGVNPDVFTPRPFRQYPMPFEILCVGRLVPAKGQFILVQAVAQLMAQNRQLRLRVVGDGPDRQALEQYVAQTGLTAHVVFEGAVNQDRILELYMQADAFVLASFAEGIPVVLMEAMIMEIPCITTHITGIPELISTGEGILVAPADIDGLAKSIATLMDNPILRRQLGQAGRQRVLNDYHLHHNTQKLAEVFQRRLQKL